MSRFVRNFTLIFPLTLLAATACGSESSTEPDPTPVIPVPVVQNVVGTATINLTVDGQAREFVVHVGRNIPANAAVPVVFMFHGTSGTGQEFYDKSYWREKADEIGFIAVFPSALTYCFRDDDNRDGDMTDPDELQATTKWTQGALNTPEMPLCSAADFALLPVDRRTRATHPFVDDIVFVDQMVAWLKANRRVDEKRIYASGFSNGAEMIQRLLVERSNVFAALHSHAGGMRVTPRPARNMSFVNSLGSKDDRFIEIVGVPFFPIIAQTLTAPGFRRIVANEQLAQCQLSDVNTYSESTIGGRRLARWMHRTSLVGASNTYEFVLFEDMTHMYPNGTNYPVPMADMIWPFFAAQRLP